MLSRKNQAGTFSQKMDLNFSSKKFAPYGQPPLIFQGKLGPPFLPNNWPIFMTPKLGRGFFEFMNSEKTTIFDDK